MEEIPDLRTRDAKRYRDGDLEIAEFGKVRHYLDELGHWQDLDLTLVPLGGNSFRVSGHDIWLDADAGGLSVYKQPSGRGIRFLFPRPPDRVDGRSAYWTTAAGVEWCFTLGRLGLKTSATIAAKRGPRTYSFDGQMLGGLAPPDPDADGNLVQPAGHFTIPRSTVMGADLVRRPCSAWRRVGGTVSFDYDDSALPPEAFPYVIDPTTTFSVLASADDGVAYNSAGSYASIPARGGGGFGITETDVNLCSKWFDGGWYWNDCGIICWDTSLIPDTAIVTAAQAQILIWSKNDADNRNLLLDWYNQLPIGGEDFVLTGQGTAGTFDITPISTSGVTNLDLINLAGVNRQGKTGILGSVSGGQPTGNNGLHFSTFDHATDVEPKLVVTYQSLQNKMLRSRRVMRR